MESVVALDGVSVRYPGASTDAIRDVTLTVRPGERVALVGPSGAGKSTMLSLAAGLVLPSAGRVEAMGVPTTSLGRRSERRTRSRIGIVSQDFALVGPLRVATNVAAGRVGRWTWTQAVKALVRPGPVDEIADVLGAVGIREKMWERADQLSGGQQQRTAIARALFQQPDLLLADEPVSALDPTRADAIMQALAAHAAGEGRAMVASMHDAPLALRHCDRIVGMRDGRIVFDRPSGDVTDEMLTEIYRFPDDGAGDGNTA